MPQQSKHLYAFGPFRLDPAQRLLFRETEIVPLTPKAVETLLLLVEKHGQLVTKDELLQRVWADTFVEEGTATRNVSSLRKALGTTPGGGEYIETHSKRGYRFVAEVNEVEEEPPAAAADSPPGKAGSALLAPRASPAWRVPATVLASLLLVAAAGMWYRGRTVAAPGNGKIQLAVLPFENLSGDPAQEYFSSGLTEEMITQLGRLEPERLQVIARTSIMQYKDAHKGTQQIGQELGVDYLLEGSVRRDGGRVRITAQLIEVKSQGHLWAEDYDRDLRDILALQSEVAGSIAQQIRLRLTPEEHARLRNVRAMNPEAYENYLKGRFFWNKRTVEGHQKAIEYFQKAVALDPNYAQAYAGLADAYSLLGSMPNAVLPRRETMSRARETAQKALSFDESLADAHASLGFVKMHYDWDFSGAEREFLRAIALNPGYATAHHWYAYDLVALGRLNDAIAQARLAQAADPLSVIISRDVGEMLMFAGHDDEAIAQCRRALEMDPNFALAHWVLAWAYHHQGKQKEFLEELQKGYPASSDPGPGIYYAWAGKTQEARRAIAKLQQDATKRFGSSQFVSMIYAQLGDKDRAFAWLEKSFEERDGGLIVLHVEPPWEPLRSDPRFEQLERRVGVLR
jgi:TolB-like protein/DNA-binding winged helix-turn-helix (wHTH) protein/Tfp pilus assembly protein PilF